MSYAKQTWTNNVSVANESRMNHIENGIYQNSLDIENAQADIETAQTDIEGLQTEFAKKSIITARLASDYIIQSTDTAADVKNFNLYNSIGNKLTVQNGVIKIGSGVSKVKVSYNATCQNSTSNATNRVFVYLMQNTATLTQESYYFNRTWEQISGTHNEIVRNVSQGDEFYLRVYGLANSKLMGGGSFCYTAITVEVID